MTPRIDPGALSSDSQGHGADPSMTDSPAPGHAERVGWSRAIPAYRGRIELIGWHEPVVTFLHDLDLATLQGQLE